MSRTPENAAKTCACCAASLQFPIIPHDQDRTTEVHRGTRRSYAVLSRCWSIVGTCVSARRRASAGRPARRNSIDLFRAVVADPWPLAAPAARSAVRCSAVPARSDYTLNNQLSLRKARDKHHFGYRQKKIIIKLRKLIEIEVLENVYNLFSKSRNEKDTSKMKH